MRPHLNVHLDIRTLAPAWAARLHAADTFTPGALSPTRPDLPALPGPATLSLPGPATPDDGQPGHLRRAAHALRASDLPGLPHPATFDDGTPLPLTVLRRLACDSQATRILLGPGSTVLDVGRSTRTVTGQLRRAVITRDRHCAYPGCHAPPHHCEIHHPHHWADGGPTSLTNSVLLCWHHHDHVHRNGITITSRVRPDGADTAGTLHPRWTFHDRHGRPLAGSAPQSRPPPA